MALSSIPRRVSLRLIVAAGCQNGDPGGSGGITCPCFEEFGQKMPVAQEIPLQCCTHQRRSDISVPTIAQRCRLEADRSSFSRSTVLRIIPITPTKPKLLVLRHRLTDPNNRMIPLVCSLPRVGLIRVCTNWWVTMGPMAIPLMCIPTRFPTGKADRCQFRQRMLMGLPVKRRQRPPF